MSKTRVFISGFVQGVGFRQFVKKNAIRLGLKGWVRNLTDGRVEAVFVGSQDRIKEIIQICKKGPFLGEIKNVHVFWQEVEEKEYFEGFEIIR